MMTQNLRILIDVSHHCLLSSYDSLTCMKLIFYQRNDVQTKQNNSFLFFSVGIRNVIKLRAPHFSSARVLENQIRGKNMVKTYVNEF